MNIYRVILRYIEKSKLTFTGLNLDKNRVALLRDSH